ncbi:hypothetical protein LG943_21110 [Streptomonospora sp. S1-112]|uniref:Deoxyxylulose-5-phosphate synthase n=1 Tax=Streptomonospora mangrovi TaxID=2883123 RepID=A0A9X3NNT3_9ACTN|nr:hypothetical protein [Streptomonospora mangrovi]MDA0566792.1 hypothetical protein [Streptomonospora mangrovi]
MCERSTVLGLHRVCPPCRFAVKRRADAVRADGTTDCPRCGRTMVDAGQDLAVPRAGDDEGWRVLTLLLEAGVTFHSSCCGGPGWRPRTLREVKERLAAARRTGVPEATALTTRDVDAIGARPRRRPAARG